jgi:hypothetical protein
LDRFRWVIYLSVCVCVHVVFYVVLGMLTTA